MKWSCLKQIISTHTYVIQTDENQRCLHHHLAPAGTEGVDVPDSTPPALEDIRASDVVPDAETYEPQATVTSTDMPDTLDGDSEGGSGTEVSAPELRRSQRRRQAPDRFGYD